MIFGTRDGCCGPQVNFCLLELYTGYDEGVSDLQSREDMERKYVTNRDLIVSVPRPDGQKSSTWLSNTSICLQKW